MEPLDARQVSVRLVTTLDDANNERTAAKDVADYQVSDVDEIPLSPQGTPVDKSLEESLPGTSSEWRFGDPVTVVIVLTVATLATRLANHWIRSNEAGVQLDLRTTPATISRLAGVPNGTLAIIHTDDSTTFHREAYDDPEDVMEKLADVPLAG